MAIIGGETFTDFSVPIEFVDRYFLLEEGSPPLVTVLLVMGHRIEVEILRNQPQESRWVEFSGDLVEFTTVKKKSSGRFLYKIHPEPDRNAVSIMFTEHNVLVVLTSDQITVRDHTIPNNRFTGKNVGVTVQTYGDVGIGEHMPQELITLLTS